MAWMLEVMKTQPGGAYANNYVADLNLDSAPKSILRALPRMLWQQELHQHRLMRTATCFKWITRRPS